MSLLTRSSALLGIVASTTFLGCNEDIAFGPEYSVLELGFSGVVTEVFTTESGSPPADIALGDPVRVVLSYVPIHGDPYATDSPDSFVRFPHAPTDYLSVEIGGHVWQASLMNLILHDDYVGHDRIEAVAGRRTDLTRLHFLVEDDVAPFRLLGSASVPVAVHEIDFPSIQGGRGTISPYSLSEFWALKFSMDEAPTVLPD